MSKEMLPDGYKPEISIALVALILNLGVIKLTELDELAVILQRVHAPTILDGLLIGAIGIGYLCFLILLGISIYKITKREEAFRPISYALACFFMVYAVLLFDTFNSTPAEREALDSDTLKNVKT